MPYNAIDAATLHLIPSSDRTVTSDVSDGSVSDTWESADLSALVPNGTIAIYGSILIDTANAGDISFLLVREGGSSDTNTLRTRVQGIGAEIGAATIIDNLSMAIILAPNGTFDYRRLTGTTVDTFLFSLWGYFL